MLKFTVPGLAFAALLGVTACQAPPPAGRSPSVGNDSAAFPAPLPQGNVATSRPMQQSPSFDNGNMRPPQPLPTGNVSTMTSPAPNGNMVAPGYGNGLPKAQ